MGIILVTILALFGLWLSVVARGTPEDPEEWDASVRWGVFVQFILWVALLFSFLSVMDMSA